MTNPDEDLLTTTEGVDEGSAASTGEGPGTGGSPAAGGEPHPPADEPVAPPVDVGTEESDAQRGPGQQLEAGEG